MSGWEEDSDPDDFAVDEGLDQPTTTDGLFFLQHAVVVRCHATKEVGVGHTELTIIGLDG